MQNNIKIQDLHRQENQKVFESVSGEELVDMRFEKQKFCVEKIIPQGLILLCGAPKIGKSWLALDICISVSNGENVMGFKTEQGTVIYLCLEDNYERIQQRVFSITDDLTDKIHFSKSAYSIDDGLLEQMESFVKLHSDTRLIVIDTFQMIRNCAKDMSYANDYAEVEALKNFADEYKISLVLIHHLRKQGDSDPVNKISGTTGLSGAADTILLLNKSKRNSNNAALYCVGRDIDERELELQFDKTECRWQLIADSADKPEKFMPQEIQSLAEMVKSVKSFNETNADFKDLYFSFCRKEISSKVLKRLMNRWREELGDLGVFFENYRSGQVRSVKVWYKPPDDINDVNDVKTAAAKSDVIDVTDVTRLRQTA